MAGAIFPDSMRSRRTLRSSAFSDAMNVPSFWLTSGVSRRARSWRSLPPSRRPPFEFEFEFEFEFGLDLILDGLERAREVAR